MISLVRRVAPPFQQPRLRGLAPGLVASLAALSVAAGDAEARVDGALTAAPRPAPIAHLAQEEDSTPVPKSVADPIRRARSALNQANVQVQAREYAKALDSLVAVRVNVSQAQKAGMAQIGAPPTDPESDDLPGPVSVLAVLNLEHRVTMVVVQLFDGMKSEKVVASLRYTLWKAHGARDVMLDAIIALDPEGEGADYADGMADTLGLYASEVKLVTGALQQYRLSPAGRLGLRNALDRVRATRAKVNKAFGGGE
jgi:hypothetical protein